MEEKDLNRIMVHSLNQDGWGYKISDDASNFTGTVQKPFDYFGCTKDFLIYGESKFIKGIYAFNFKRIYPHQMLALLRIKSCTQQIPVENCHTIISVGFWESRKFFYVLFFDAALINSLSMQGKASFKKKELDKFIEKGQYLEIKKNEIVNFSELPRKIIYTFEGY